MATAPLANASAASRMSEEAVDLICSFVRGMDGPGSTRTLRALMLTSRQFVSSATRALLHDPTQHLRCDWYRFSTLALRVWQNPHLGRYIKRLDKLAVIIEDGFSPYDYEFAAAHQLVLSAFLRQCVDLRSISIPGDFPPHWMQWAQELKQIDSVSQATLSCTCSESEDQYGMIVELLALDILPHLSNLRLEHYVWVTDDFLDQRPLTLAVTELSIINCQVWDHEDWQAVPISCPHLRRFEFRPTAAPHTLPLGLFSPTLESLVMGPAVRSAPLVQQDDSGWYGRWSFPLGSLPRLPKLQSIELVHAWQRAGDLQVLASVCPALRIIRLTRATWHVDEWEIGAISDRQLLADLTLFPFLRHVDLGYLPRPYYEGWRLIPLTRRYCRERNIKVEFARLTELEDTIEHEASSSDSSYDGSFTPTRRDASPSASLHAPTNSDAGDRASQPSSLASRYSSYATSETDGDVGLDAVPPDWGYRTVGPADFAAAHPPSSPSYVPPSPREEQIVFEEVQTTGWEAEESSSSSEEEMQVDWSGSSDGEDADREWREFEGAFDDLDALM